MSCACCGLASGTFCTLSTLILGTNWKNRSDQLTLQLRTLLRKVMHLSRSHDNEIPTLASVSIGLGSVSILNPFLLPGISTVKTQWASLLAQWSRICLPSREVVQSLGQEDPLELEMATHSSILAWEIPRTEEPGGLQSMRSHRVRHDLATNNKHSINMN